MKGFIIYVILVVSLILIRLSLNDNTLNENTTVLNLWTFQAAHEKFYKEMEQSWNEENPNEKITLEISVLPSEDMHNKLLVCSTSNTGCPDIADIEVKRFPLFLEGDNLPLLDLTDYIKSYDNNYVESRFNLYKKNNRNYGIPSHVGAEVMYYNEDIMDAANVDSSKILTWSDYIDAGYVVKEKTGKPMTVIETSENLIIWPILVQYGADYFNEDGKLDVANKEAIKIYSEIQKLIRDGIIEVAPGGKVHAEDFYGYMNNGNVASLPMPLWYMNRFTDYMPDLKGKISVQKYPINPQNPDLETVGIGGTGTVVFNSSKNADLSARFISYAKLSDYGSKKAWELLGFTPVNSSIWNQLELSSEYENYFINNPLNILKQYDPKKIKSPNFNEEITEVTKELNTNMYFELFDSLKDPSTETVKEENVLKK